MKRLALAAVLLAGTALATPASATTLTLADIGGSGTGTFDGGIGSGTRIPAIHGSLTLTLTSVVAATNTWNFSYSFTNTTVSPWTASMPSFGFDTDPTLQGATVTGFFNKVDLGGNISGGNNKLDFCATAGAGCAGGSSNGLDPGQTGTGTFSLDFANSANASTVITLSGYLDRYQEITCLIPAQCGNVHGESGIGFGTDVVINPVISPVPGQWLVQASPA